MMLKPPIKSTKFPVMHAISGTSLTRHVDGLLLSEAQVISEGAIEVSAAGDATYFGSTYVSIDLERPDLDLPRGADGRRSLVDALGRSIFFRSRLLRVARQEVENRSGVRLPKCMAVESEFKIEDTKLLVDISIECPLADPLVQTDPIDEEIR